MEANSRRTVLRSAAALGVAGTAAGSAGAAPAAASPAQSAPDPAAGPPPVPDPLSAQGHRDPGRPRWTKEERADRRRVLKAGFTEDEADCWLLLVRAAGKFFELPELHPSDVPEAATAVHVIQNKLLMRPAYRVYLRAAEEDGTAPGDGGRNRR